LAERWYVAHIFLKPDTYAQRDKVLVDTIEPIVERLEKAGLIENFHFLFEPNLEILFRVRLREDALLDSVKSIVADGLNSIANLCAKMDYEEGYAGEGDPKADWSFGTEGWELAQKFMDIGSRITLLTRNVAMGRKDISSGRLDSLFTPEKLVHLLLNQCGQGVLEESKFHSLAAIERALFGFRVFQRLEQLEKVVQKLTEQPPR